MQVSREQSKLKSFTLVRLPKMRTYIGTGKYVTQLSNDSTPYDITVHSPQERANSAIRTAAADINSKYRKGLISLEEKKASQAAAQASAQAAVNNSQLTPPTAPER